MTHPAPPAAVDRIVTRLAALRGRVRRILAVAGVGRLLAWTGVILAVWFLCDVALDLPLAVRRFVRLGLSDRPLGMGVAPWAAALVGCAALCWVTARHRSPFAGVFAFGLAGVPGVLGWVAARHLIAPLRLPLTDEALAGSVEARFRSLKDRVAAALDFDRELAHPSRAESRAMMTRVVEEAGVEIDRVEVAAVASARSARRAALLGVAAGAATALLFAAMPGDASLWARRALALEDVGWPRRTTMLAVVVGPDGRETVKDPSTPYVAALGQSFVVTARAEGRVPAEVELVDRVASDDAASRPLAHRMRAVSDRPGRFEHEFRDVRGDFTFTLRGGDDDDEVPVYRVSVRVPPRVVGLRADLTYPAYLGLPTRRVDGGVVTVPEGTRVAVSFASDAVATAARPDGGVARAEAWVGDAAVDVAREGEPGAPSFTFAFVATASTRFRVRVVTGDGRENDAAADTYEVAVEPDTPPRPDWVFPRAGFSTTPSGRIPLFLDTVDDHGVASLRLEVLGGAAGASDAPTVIPLAVRRADGTGANDRPYGAGSILSYLPLDVPAVGAEGAPPTAPSRLLVRAVATDAKGQEASGPWLAVDLLRPDELERTLAAQRSRAKTDVEAVREDVRAVEAVLTALATQDALSEPDRLLLRDVAHKAGKARADADRAGRAVTSIFLAHAYGRLAAEAPTTTLLALLDRHHRSAFTRATDARAAAATSTGASAGAAGEGDVFPWSVFREVVAARRSRVLFDSGVLDRMISVVEHLLEAAEVAGPAAAGRALSVARDATLADVAALRDAVTTWRTSLDAALSAMAEWQSLAELTLFVRRLVEEQERIDKDIEGLDAAGATRRKDGGR